VAGTRSDDSAAREAATIARYQQVEALLSARWPENRIAPTLTRIAAITELLGEPQRAYPVIHLAGTNGKTSTARMIESLLGAFGLTPGLFTSPHLHSMRERIRVAGEPVSVERFVAGYDDIAPYLAIIDQRAMQIDGTQLSFFESITALAFALFADAPVDVAVIETGLGGTWDATNIVDGKVAVITPVALDHQEYLGDTVAQIAGEKAGIIKAGSEVVLSQQVQPAAEVLLTRVGEVGAGVVREGLDFALVHRDLAVGGQLVTLQGLGGRYEDLFLPLFGAHQAHNAAVALAAVESFLGGGQSTLDIELVRKGFADVTSPGRLEVVRRGPTVLVDAAHNPHGALALAEGVRDGFDFTHIVGLVAVLAGKDARGLLEALEPLLAEVVVSSNSSPRALDPDELGAIAVEVFGSQRVEVVPRFPDAVETAVRLADEAAAELGGGTGVLITGSVVTAADGRALLGRTEV
jgi:dihydrofolate synthase/folylpolyglutamate synthase